MDFSQIESVLGLASTALGATGKAVSTVEAVKKLLKGDKKPDDNNEAANLLNTLATELTAVNMMNVQLSEALRELSRELKRQDDFEKEKARYSLFETGERDMVFKLKEDVAHGQPIHFVCPVCLNRDKLFSYITGEDDYKICQTDKAHFFKFRDTPIRQPGRARTDWSPHDF
ncbi:hypothetical protein FJ942_17055 [Mesorhizobium sp. B2-4-2]|uniref:hypothetical protein n=1 Tax=Mesorhizobium sp. B2-4-2 TaxID=2589947 RepID=UPI001127C166|nr:hypothetical protein [Mesorhizobium sp. B2-4-2]TPL55414.1 hypothetical protein FJ942_17055 [Mesorhizobium sp. B2-4-2]